MGDLLVNLFKVFCTCLLLCKSAPAQAGTYSNLSVFSRKTHDVNVPYTFYETSFPHVLPKYEKKHVNYNGCFNIYSKVNKIPLNVLIGSSNDYSSATMDRIRFKATRLYANIWNPLNNDQLQPFNECSKKCFVTFCFRSFYY